MMLYRRHQVWSLIFVKGRLLQYGIQARIARLLGVARMTISRDVRALLKIGHPCRECGAYCHESITDPFDDSNSANPRLHPQDEDYSDG
jgi:hypothetical protein